MNILFLRGINDDNKVEPLLSSDGQMIFRIDGSASIFRHMYAQEPYASSLVLFGQKVRQKSISLHEKPDVVFNEISDPDSHKGALARGEKLCTGFDAPIINPPHLIGQTTRDQIAHRLSNIAGVSMPLTVRCRPKSPDDIFATIQKESLAYPVIVRLAGQHGGTSSILIRSSGDQDRLHVYPFDGRDFYLTQYVDYQDDDGLFRKYRIVVIAGRPYFRHVLIGDHWMVHASSFEFAKQREDLLSEMRQRRLVFDDELAPQISAAVQEIHRRIQLDYFGLDCHIDDDGKLLLFEVNANMNVLHDPEDTLKEAVDKIKQGIHRLIKSKIKTT